MHWYILLTLGCPVEPPSHKSMSTEGRAVIFDDTKPPKDQGVPPPSPQQGPPSQQQGQPSPAEQAKDGAPIPPVSGDGQMPPGIEGKAPAEVPTADSIEGTPPLNGDASPEIDPPPASIAPGEINTPEGPQPRLGEMLGTENTAGDVMTMYHRLPMFIDIIEDQSITITLEVENVDTFDVEFVVQREDENRVFPKVLHKQVEVSSPVRIQAPANFSEPVWIFISVDKLGDGLSEDDLVGGSPQEVMLKDKDLSLRYVLSTDRQFLRTLPWYSEASEGPPQ